MKPSIPISELIGMPMIGYGTAKIPPEDAGLLVSQAIELGYTHLDFAHVYKNEKEIGETLCLTPNRKNLFLTSKLWSTDHVPHRVLPAFNFTLKNLQLEYLDLYLIHIPIRFSDTNQPLYYKKEWILETWREMVKLKESGRVKYIGVSNFTTVKLGWLLDEDEKPSNNQGIAEIKPVELHPYLPQRKLVEFCKNNRIEISGHSPLGSGLAKTPNAVDTTKSEIPQLLEDPLINEISRKHKASPAQVLLKWEMQLGYPVLVKCSSKKRMKENLESLNLHLSDEEIMSINKIPTKYRYHHGEALYSPEHTAEEFWDGEYFN